MNLVDWASFAREHANSTSRRLLQTTKHAITSEGPTVTALKQGYQYWNQSRADDGAESIIKRLEATDFGSSEFLLVNLMETHMPYHSPDDTGTVEVNIGDAFGGNIDNPEYIEAAYDTSLNYLHDKLERIFEIQ